MRKIAGKYLIACASEFDALEKEREERLPELQMRWLGAGCYVYSYRASSLSLSLILTLSTYDGES
jgi:hypothetical protein